MAFNTLQPPATGPISNASAAYLGVDALDVADGTPRFITASILRLLRCCRISVFPVWADLQLRQQHLVTAATVLRSQGSVLQFVLAEEQQAWSAKVDWDSVMNLWQLY